MPLVVLLIISLVSLFSITFFVAEDYLKTAFVSFLISVGGFGWITVASLFEGKIISETSIESFTRDNTDYLLYKETLYNLNKKFGRDFEDKTMFLVKKYSPWAGGIYWMDSTIEMEPIENE